MFGDVGFLIAHKPKQAIVRSYWTHPQRAASSDYSITSTFAEKSLYKRLTRGHSLWHPGINFHTFKALAGVYPGIEQLTAMVEEISHLEHNDYNPCNFIIQGTRLVPIDLNDPRRKTDRQTGYERLIKMIAA
jgi:hypothetical protein